MERDQARRDAVNARRRQLRDEKAAAKVKRAALLAYLLLALHSRASVPL